MAGRMPVNDAELAREHRRRHVRGSAVDAITNPALRICLANCAQISRKHEGSKQPPPDGKRHAAGDTD